MSTGKVHAHVTPAQRQRLTLAYTQPWAFMLLLYHIYTKTCNPVISFVLHMMKSLGVEACNSTPCILPKVQYIICGRSPAKSSQFILAWEE